MRNINSKPRRIPEFDSEYERGEFYRNKALYFLEIRMRTEQQVREYLGEWECPESLLEEIIGFLREYHYLDDAAFAAAYIRQERELNHRSRRDITQRLIQKGVDREIITQAFDEEGEELPEEDPETEQARALVLKRIRSGKTEREKMIGFLERRGFSYQTIRKVLDLELTDQDI